jgi:hypothetical protein
LIISAWGTPNVDLVWAGALVAVDDELISWLKETYALG